MRFTLTAAVLSLAASATALDFALCAAADKGGCEDTRDTTLDDCHRFTSGSKWTNNVESFKISPGYHCNFWNTEFCNGDSTGDIGNGGGNVNIEASSYKCYSD